MIYRKYLANKYKWYKSVNKKEGIFDINSF